MWPTASCATRARLRRRFLSLGPDVVLQAGTSQRPSSQECASAGRLVRRARLQARLGEAEHRPVRRRARQRLLEEYGRRGVPTSRSPAPGVYRSRKDTAAALSGVTSATGRRGRAAGRILHLARRGDDGVGRHARPRRRRGRCRHALLQRPRGERNASASRTARPRKSGSRRASPSSARSSTQV